jgi:prepilin-type N-terminal cleavage/methylation domain-containing protein
MRMSERVRQSGVTLPELLVTLAAGSLMSIAFLQVYLDINQNHLSLRQSRELLHAHHVLRSVLQAEFAAYVISDSDQMISRWHEGADFDRPSAAISGSDVIRFNGSTFYVAHRGRRRDQPTGLYRRRDRTATSYYPAEEIVDGVTALQLELCDTRCDSKPDGLPISQLSGVRIYYALRPDQRMPHQYVLTMAVEPWRSDDE